MERRKSWGQDDFWCCSLAADVQARETEEIPTEVTKDTVFMCFTVAPSWMLS